MNIQIQCIKICRMQLKQCLKGNLLQSLINDLSFHSKKPEKEHKRGIRVFSLESVLRIKRDVGCASASTVNTV